MRTLVMLILVAGSIGAQQNLDELKKTAKAYLTAEEDQAREMEAALNAVPPLSKAEAKTWTDWVKKTMRTVGPKLDLKGTNYFYDKEQKVGKYIVAGGDNRKGLVFGLHGGGEGQADCGGAAGSWRGAIDSAGMIGIFPEAMKATEAAWGDDITVKFIVDLLAAAQRTFTFDPDRVYVVGHSMGGYGAWTWGGRFSDRLAAVVSFAGAPTPIFEEKKVTGIQPGLLPNFFNMPIWVYHSADDPQVPIAPTRFAVAELKNLQASYKAGFVLHYEEEEKQGHAFPPKGTKPAVTWMAGYKRDPTPKKIVWQSFYERPGQSYWLSCERPTQRMVLEATWDGKSAFEIKGEPDDKSVGVLLNDRMCDLDQPVRVAYNGKPLFAGVAKRSLAVLLRSARRRYDPELLFTATAP